MEVWFEYAVECEKISDSQCESPVVALEKAQKRWQEMCDEGDYEYGYGDASIFVVDAMNGNALMAAEYKVFSEKDMAEKPYLQSEFI